MSEGPEKQRFQFSISSLLLALSFAGISAGGALHVWRRLVPEERGLLGPQLLVLSPIIVPLLYVAYSMGRRRLTLITLLAFAITEVAAIVWPLWIYLFPKI